MFWSHNSDLLEQWYSSGLLFQERNSLIPLGPEQKTAAICFEIFLNTINQIWTNQLATITLHNDHCCSDASEHFTAEYLPKEAGNGPKSQICARLTDRLPHVHVSDFIYNFQQLVFNAKILGLLEMGLPSIIQFFCSLISLVHVHTFVYM